MYEDLCTADGHDVGPVLERKAALKLVLCNCLQMSHILVSI